MSDDLALTYNDKSPLESMHTAEFFKLLQKNPTFDVSARLERKEQQDVRKCIIQMILATDMSVHFDYLDKFNKRFPARDASTVTTGAEVSNDDQNFAMAVSPLSPSLFEPHARAADGRLALSAHGWTRLATDS